MPPYTVKELKDIKLKELHAYRKQLLEDIKELTKTLHETEDLIIATEEGSQRPKSNLLTY